MKNELAKLLDNVSKAVVMYHIDSDGICSAKIMNEALHRFSIEVVDYFPATPKLLNSSDFQIGVDRSRPDIIIILDCYLSADSCLFKNNKDLKFLIIDHHDVKNIPSGDNVLYINPKLNNVKKYIPAAKIVFDTVKKLVEIDDLDWVSAIGIIGDSGAPQHKSFIQKVFEKYGLETGKDKKYFFDSFLGRLSNIVDTGKIVKGSDGANISLKVLQESGTPREFYEKAYQLRQWYDKVEDYIENELLNFEQKKEEIKELDLIFYVFKPEFHVGSVLSTIASFKHSHKTVVLFSKKNAQTTTINFRRQDKKYDMGLLAAKSTEGLQNAGGGGHVPAAGGHIQTSDLNALKGKIINELKKMMKK